MEKEIQGAQEMENGQKKKKDGTLFEWLGFLEKLNDNIDTDLIY